MRPVVLLAANSGWLSSRVTCTMTAALRTFLSYSHKDHDLREAVVEHLALLRHDSTLSIWTDRAIKAGDEFDEVIAAKLREADSRAAAREFRVRELGVLLREGDGRGAGTGTTWGEYAEWSRSSCAHATGKPPLLLPLTALPTDGKPVTDRRFWHDNDEALVDVAVSLRKTLAQPLATAAARPTNR